MKNANPRAMPMLMAMVSVIVLSCGKKTGEPSVKDAGPAVRLLVGEIAESVLPEIHYKRLSYGGSVQGGGEHRNEMLKLDALIYKPLATQWAGIKSLEPIPGKGGNTFFRYDLIAELYPDAVAAKRREAEFDARFRAYLDAGGAETAKGSMPPCPRFIFRMDGCFTY